MERHVKLPASKLMNMQRRKLAEQEISKIYDDESSSHRDHLYIDLWLHIEALEARSIALEAELKVDAPEHPLCVVCGRPILLAAVGSDEEGWMHLRCSKL